MDYANEQLEIAQRIHEIRLITAVDEQTATVIAEGMSHKAWPGFKDALLRGDVTATDLRGMAELAKAGMGSERPE